MINQKSSKKDQDGEAIKGIPLASLKLTPSKVRALNENGIRYINDLKGITFKELYALPGLGKKTVSGIIKYTARVFVEPLPSGLFAEIQRIPTHVADINLLEQGLTVRLRNVLSAANLSLIRDVLPYSEALIKSLPNMGSKTLTELKDYLASKEVAWGGVPYTIYDSADETNQEPLPVIQPEDKPLPEYLYNHFSVRAKNLLRKAGIDSCVKLIKLNPADVLKFKNAGRYTWNEIEKIKPDLVRYLAEGTYWCLDFRRYPNYESFLAKFLSSFHPYPKCDLIFDHRLAIRGSGQDKTLEETAKFLSVTRERIRQVETKVRKHYFGAAGRTMIESFLTLARDTILAFSGATNPNQFANKIDELTGWTPATIPDPLINLLVCFEVLHYDRQKNIIITPDFYQFTIAFNRLFVQFCSDRNRPFSAIGYDDFLVYLRECGKVTQYTISFEAYKVWGIDLLGKNTLPADKKQQLKAFIYGLKESSLDAIGDKRRISSKLLEVLRNSKKALTVGKWQELANHTFPKDKFTANQIRGLCSHYTEQIINYDRGYFIWHEHVSISSSLAMWFEDQILLHMQKYAVDVISIFRIFEEKKKDLQEVGIPTQTLLYFLLKRNSSGRIHYPEYPKVSLPNAEGGAGVFTQIMRARLFNKKGIKLAELHDFYSNILCADKRFVLAIPELKRRGVLYYLEPDSISENKDTYQTFPDFTRGEPYQPEQVISKNERNRITEVLEDRFINGFRLNSEIEIQRFKKYYQEKHKCAFSLNDIAFCKILEAMGIRHSGKVFMPSAEEKMRITEILNIAFETGAKTIFYEAFLEHHITELAELRIHSGKMLQDYLIKIKPDLHFEQEYFSSDASVTPVTDIICCFHDEKKVLSWETIAAKCPYIPIAKIRRLLYKNHCFVPVSRTGKYTYIDYNDITENDRQKAMKFIEEGLLAADYISVHEFDVSEILSRNLELSESTVRKQLFRFCSEDKFVRAGDIIFRKGEQFDALKILKDYCRGRNEMTLNEIAFQSQLFFGSKNQVFLRVANEMMVRINRDLFVSDANLSFNVTHIDLTLENICTGAYMPLQEVNCFSCFTYPGYAWNSYLLTSYVRRFSRSFRFVALSATSTSGVIVRRDAIFTDYRQILADALAKSDVNLTEAEIVDFLFGKGYIDKPILSNTADIINAAHFIRGA